MDIVGKIPTCMDISSFLFVHLASCRVDHLSRAKLEYLVGVSFKSIYSGKEYTANHIVSTSHFLLFLLVHSPLDVKNVGLGS